MLARAWRAKNGAARPPADAGQHAVVVAKSLFLTLFMLVFCGLPLACDGPAKTAAPTIKTPPDQASATCAPECEPWQACVAGQCECHPRCSEQTACQDDECGGTCPCPDGLVQSATGVFVAPEECHDSCESAGWACGSVCGADCGSCDAGLSCVHGHCECKPSCDGSRCDDGCGGYCPCGEGTVCNAASQCVAPEDCKDTCQSQKLNCGEMCGAACGACSDSQSCVQGSCAEAISCENCPLSLRLVGKKLSAGKLSEITLAVDFAPNELEPRPRMADFRLRASRPAMVRAAHAGPALTDAQKSLVRFEPWAEPWRRRGDGAFQLLAYEASNTELLGEGRLVEIKLSLDEWGPVRFSLQRREQIFAPPEADSAVQSSSYDSDVIVTR